MSLVPNVFLLQLTPLPKSYSALTTPSSSKGTSPTGSDDEDDSENSEEEYIQLQALRTEISPQGSSSSSGTRGGAGSPSKREKDVEEGFKEINI